MVSSSAPSYVTFKGHYSTIHFEHTRESGLIVLMKGRLLQVRRVIEEDRPFYEQLIHKDIIGIKKKPQLDQWIREWKKGNPFSGFTVLVNEEFDYLGYVSLQMCENPGTVEFKHKFHPVDQKSYERYCVLAMKMVLEDYVPIVKQMGYLIERSPLTQVIAKAYKKGRMVGLFASIPKMKITHAHQKLVYSLPLEAKERKCCRMKTCVIL